MFRLVRFEVYKLFRLRSVRLGLLFALLLPFLWALAPGLKEAYGLVLASGWQVVSLSLLAGMEFLFPFLVVVAASETLGSEVAQGTLKSLLLRPLSRTHLLLAKLFAVLLYPFVLLGASFLGGCSRGCPMGLGPSTAARASGKGVRRGGASEPPGGPRRAPEGPPPRRGRAPSPRLLGPPLRDRLPLHHGERPGRRGHPPPHAPPRGLPRPHALPPHHLFGPLPAARGRRAWATPPPPLHPGLRPPRRLGL